MEAVATHLQDLQHKKIILSQANKVTSKTKQLHKVCKKLDYRQENTSKFKNIQQSHSLLVRLNRLANLQSSLHKNLCVVLIAESIHRGVHEHVNTSQPCRTILSQTLAPKDLQHRPTTQTAATLRLFSLRSTQENPACASTCLHK